MIIMHHASLVTSSVRKLAIWTAYWLYVFPCSIHHHITSTCMHKWIVSFIGDNFKQICFFHSPHVHVWRNFVCKHSQVVFNFVPYFHHHNSHPPPPCSCGNKFFVRVFTNYLILSLKNVTFCEVNCWVIHCLLIP